MKKCLLTIPLIVILSWFTCAGAEVVYKWTDPQGRVHFSDRPQEGSEAIALPGSPRYSSGRREEPPKAAAAAATGAPDGAASGAQPEDQAKHEEMRRKNCEIARQTLERNQNMGRMFRIGADGQRVYLSEEERAAVLKRSRDDVAHWCD